MDRGRTAAQKNRSTTIDGLRALGMLSILLYHFQTHRLPGGFLGVDLFFLLSGFLLTGKLLQEEEPLQVRAYIGFVKKRIRQLYPPLLAMMVSVTAFLFLFQRELLLNLRGWVLSSLFMVNNWWQIDRGVSYFDQFFAPSPFTHLWYLSLLLQYSLLWPLLLKNRLDRNQKIGIIAFLILFSQAAGFFLFRPEADPTRVYYGTDTRFYAFGIGALTVGLLPLLEGKGRKRMWNWVGAAALVGIFLLEKQLYDAAALTYQGGMLLHSLLAAAFLLAAWSPGSPFHFLLRFKPLQWLGRRSYWVYLWYYPVFIVLQRLPGVNTGIIAGIWPFALIFALAEVSYRLMDREERTVRQWRDRWQEVWRRPGKKAWYAKVGSLLPGAAAVLFLAAFWTAPAGEPPAMVELKEQISKNIAQQGSRQEKQTAHEAPVPKVEGLPLEVARYTGSLQATFIGDSILLSALAEVEQVFPSAVLDGEVGRQLYQSMPVIEAHGASGMLQDTVIFLLGSNGDFTAEQMEELVAAVGPDRKIFLVTTGVPRPWRDAVNNGMWQAQETYANVQILDWYAVMKDHPDWLREDGVHPNQQGARQLALFLAQALYGLQTEETSVSG